MKRKLNCKDLGGFLPDIENTIGSSLLSGVQTGLETGSPIGAASSVAMSLFTAALNKTLNQKQIGKSFTNLNTSTNPYMANGGYLINYKGNRHENGGILINEESGYPTLNSETEVEGNEVLWSNRGKRYIFSDRLKIR